MSTHIHVADTEADVEAGTQPLSTQVTWHLTIALLFCAAFCLGFPQFHYTAAIMIAAVIRYKDTSDDIFAPVR